MFPVSSKVLRTKFNTQVAISVSWAVSLLLSCPALFLHGLVESKAEDDQVGSNSIRLSPLQVRESDVVDASFLCHKDTAQGTQSKPPTIGAFLAFDCVFMV